ncbi:hypothetical protein EC973_007071 [Apophysomyces ossiformis]|uniref:Fork-head domain-containing protein n=1 Tax=Apophysomyces ossiformis TaxID=679940 RepID=A0A8H7C0M3_9FUNG|nr:hypothetical protein EC973_007071 [Apophysomyces ossiformis]
MYTNYSGTMAAAPIATLPCTQGDGSFGLQTENNSSSINNDNNRFKALPIEPSWRPQNPREKPPYSYATMIAHAILCSEERKLTLSDIYRWIATHYPYYSLNNHGWQNSIRHNLSLNKSFVKMGKSVTETSPRKGCYWTIQEGHEQPFINNLVKRHSAKRQSTSCSQSNSLRQPRRRRSSSMSTASVKKGPSLSITAKRRKSADDSQDSDCDSGVDLESSASSIKTEEIKGLQYDALQAMTNFPQQALLDEQSYYMQFPLGTLSDSSFEWQIPKSQPYYHDASGYTQRDKSLTAEQWNLFGIGPATANIIHSLDWPF